MSGIRWADREAGGSDPLLVVGASRLVDLYCAGLGIAKEQGLVKGEGRLVIRADGDMAACDGLRRLRRGSTRPNAAAPRLHSAVTGPSDDGRSGKRIRADSAVQELVDCLRQCPIIAILRGVPTEQSAAVCEALITAGVKAIEVPLNSPTPFASLEAMVRQARGRALLGCGTVLTAAQVDMVHKSGGRMVVSPNTNPEVIRRTKQLGMLSIPGFFTATEALQALDAGADALKLFPAGPAGPAYLKDLRAVLDPRLLILPVGGVDLSNIAAFKAAGAGGFGIGGALYKPGDTAEMVLAKASEFVRNLV